MSYAQHSKSTPHNVEAFRDFKGSSADEETNVVVKMDCARELVAAAKELKWLPDKSLENKWPHNTVHEMGRYTQIRPARVFVSIWVPFPHMELVFEICLRDTFVNAVGTNTTQRGQRGWDN